MIKTVCQKRIRKDLVLFKKERKGRIDKKLVQQ